MKILFEFGHPGHVHLFKYIIRHLQKKGHYPVLIVRERENIVSHLLNYYGFKYIKINTITLKSPVWKGWQLFKNNLKLLKIAKINKIDLFGGMLSPYSAQVSAIMNKPHIGFADTEDATMVLRLAVPFTDVIITEKNYLGKLPLFKHVSIPTWRPLTYLHPKYFTPDTKILDYLNISRDDKFFIVRFSAFDASHDWRIKRNITWEDRWKFIKYLEKIGKIFIFSEMPLPKKLKDYEVNIDPIYFHDLLAFSSGYIGEGHIAAREAVMLGKPAILISPRGRLEGCNVELERKGFLTILETYKNLTSQILDDFVCEKNSSKIKKEFSNLLDFNKFFIWFIENYPESHLKYKDDPIAINNIFRF